MEKLTDDRLRRIEKHPGDPNRSEIERLATELLALRAAWKIARPFLPDPVYRRCLAALEPGQ